MPSNTIAPETPTHEFSSQWQAQNLDYFMTAIATIPVYLNEFVDPTQRQDWGTLEQYSERLRAIAAQMAVPPRLNHIAQLFGLSVFEQRVLLCCAGQAIDPNFPNLLAIAHNNPERAYPTFQLALQCFPDPHWNALTSDRPLRRWQLIHCAASPEPSRACLQIDEAILNYLMGESYRDPVLAGSLTQLAAPAEAIALQPSYQTMVEQMVALLRTEHPISPLIQLCGTRREAQGAIAAQVSHQLQIPRFVLPSEVIPREHEELQALIMRIQRSLTLDPGILQVEITTPPAVMEQSRPPLVDTFLRWVNVPLVLITDQRLPLSHPAMFTFDVAGLQYGEQLELWQAAWPDAPETFKTDLARLASQFRLSDTLIQTASTAVQGDETYPETEWGDRLWDFCRSQARPQLEGLAQRIAINATWADLILPERENAILHQITTHVRQQAKVYQQWGFAHKNQRGLGLTALFAGVSGTGKTTAAEIVAHELSLDLFRIDLSAVMSKYIGETEKNLRRIFDAAEVGGAVLLFDEADALFGKRTQVKDSHDRHANIEVSYLLQRMEAYQGLAILTTNLKDDLDQAFLRRLRFVVNFPYPKAPERSRIWERAFPTQAPTEGLDFELLGQLDVTGGNIKSIALNAAFIAAAADEPVKMKHILEATKTEYLKLGRSLTKSETQYWNLD